MADDLYKWVCRCGEQNWMTQELQRLLRRTNQTFHCVHGHESYYPVGKTEAQKLQDQLDAERRERQRVEQRIAQKDDEIRDWRATADDQRAKAEHERHRANGYKGHATRIAKRAKAGVCPCCNRTFVQLARHMATQHPQFTPEAPEPPRLKVVNG